MIATKDRTRAPEGSLQNDRTIAGLSALAGKIASGAERLQWLLGNVEEPNDFPPLEAAETLVKLHAMGRELNRVADRIADRFSGASDEDGDGK